MENIDKYISSGIVEMYVLGLSSKEESEELEALAASHPEIKEEIQAVSEALLLYKRSKTNINPGIKSMLMAVIDYTERLKSGEEPASLPLLNENSKIEDYAPWLNREDMVYDADFGYPYAKLIGYEHTAMTAIVWMAGEIPYEVHDKEYEKFLVVEGSCDIITAEKVISLKKGDFVSLPLYLGHSVKITSDIPCKVVLQRIAA